MGRGASHPTVRRSGAAYSKNFLSSQHEKLINISPSSPETGLRRRSFAKPDQQFYALVLHHIYSKNIGITLSFSLGELDRPETLVPKSATSPAVG